MKPLCVEFIGIPASGKSAFATALAATLRRDAPTRTVLHGEHTWLDFLRRRDDGPWKNLLKRLPAAAWAPLRMTVQLPEFVKASARRPGLLANHAAAMARRTLPYDWAYMVNFAFVRSLCEQELAEANLRNGDVWLQEEGLAQRAFSLYGYFDEPRPEAELKHYLDQAPVPDVLVVMDTPVEVCHERLRKRPFYPILVERHPPERRLAQWSKGVDVITFIADELARRGARVLRTAGDGALAEPAARLARELLAPANPTVNA